MSTDLERSAGERAANLDAQIGPGGNHTRFIVSSTECEYDPSSMLVAFPTSLPDGEAFAHVELSAHLDDVPTWSLQTLNVGPARSSPTYSQHLNATIGSSYDWSNELRFDKRSGKLTSFVFKTPEAGTLDPAIARSWLALPRTAGIPVLDHRENGFPVDPLDLRYLSDDAGALVVASAALPLADRDSLRLAIDRDTDLLFHHGRYCGPEQDQQPRLDPPLLGVLAGHCVTT